MKRKTCKFGGTSLADADAFRIAAGIIEGDATRRFIVVSAPGKRFPQDQKITDLLLGWYHNIENGLDPAQPIAIISERFNELVAKLELNFDIQAEIDLIADKAAFHTGPDYLASRGEYLSGRIMAELLDARFVEPADYIAIDSRGQIDPVTYANLGEALSGDGRFVIPGFYGTDPKGRIKTFSRGGSDVTGSIVARAVAATLYENWTDVSGFRMTDPRIVPHARCIETITYSELRELAYMGATVLHDEAIFPVREAGIPINIRNTHAPKDAGTMIVREREAKEPVLGIAARSGFTMINIEKTLMNKEIGFGRKVLTVLEEFGVSFEHMPTGIDTISLIVRDEFLNDHGEAIKESLQRVVNPDEVTLAPGLALIATVGQGMNHHIGVAGRLCTALAEAGVNLRVIDQGSSETNIIVGVEDTDLETAVTAIYRAFEDGAV